MQGWPCPIYDDNCFWEPKNTQATFPEKPQMKIKWINHAYLIMLDKTKLLTGTVVNQALLSLQGGSLEITFIAL